MFIRTSIRKDLFLSAFSHNTVFFLGNYRIHAYNTPLLIKPPLQQNLNKPPLFCLKSPLFKAFWGKNPEKFQ